MVNTPITDNLSFRGSISSSNSDGYCDNIFLGIDGTDYAISQNFRGSLRWLPNDNWTVDARVQIGTRPQRSARPAVLTADPAVGARRARRRWPGRRALLGYSGQSRDELP